MKLEDYSPQARAFITPEQIETLEQLFGDSKMPIDTDEDYRKLAEIFDDLEGLNNDGHIFQ
jgi:hypothetical protein